VVITYDRRPFVDWYKNYASRRDDTRGIIAIQVEKHMAWLQSIMVHDNVEIMSMLRKWWDDPITHGVKNYGRTIGRIMDCEERRRAHTAVVVHNPRNEVSDDDTSSEESDDGEPEAIVPLPLR
jgi:hypothetical protein